MDKETNKLPPFDKLDAVLLLLNSDTIIADNGVESEMVPLTFKEIQKRLNFKINDRDITLLLDKLVKEGYLEKNTVEGNGSLTDGRIVAGKITRYWLNFDGQYFLLNGGYVQKNANDLLQIQIQQDEVKRRIRNDLLLAQGTKWIAVGTIALAVVELIKFSSEYFCST
jgi:hypothetical protein